MSKWTTLFCDDFEMSKTFPAQFKDKKGTARRTKRETILQQKWRF
jgi:hypothetical protein